MKWLALVVAFLLFSFQVVVVAEVVAFQGFEEKDLNLAGVHSLATACLFRKQSVLRHRQLPPVRNLLTNGCKAYNERLLPRPAKSGKSWARFRNAC